MLVSTHNAILDARLPPSESSPALTSTNFLPEFATLIKQEVGGESIIEYLPAVEDDPQRRRPDISVAKSVLGWEPRVKLLQGLSKTIQFFRNELTSQNNRPLHPNEYQVEDEQTCEKPEDDKCKEL